MPVRDLLNRMDSREIAEWVAYFRIDKKRMERAEMDIKARQSMNQAKQSVKR